MLHGVKSTVKILVASWAPVWPVVKTAMAVMLKIDMLILSK